MTPVLLRSDVDQSAKYFVAQDHPEDDDFAVAIPRVDDRQHGSKEIARVAGERPGIGVIKIEIADHYSIGESSQVGRGFSTADQNRRRHRRSYLGGGGDGDLGRRTTSATERTPNRIQGDLLGPADYFLRQIAIGKL